jgi:hypothetical protein
VLRWLSCASDGAPRWLLRASPGGGAPRGRPIGPWRLPHDRRWGNRLRQRMADACVVDRGGRATIPSDPCTERARRLLREVTSVLDEGIPPATRRFVKHRDGGHCTVDGCRAATFLDAHHLTPRADGGPSDDPDQITLLCVGHHRALHLGKLVIRGKPSTGLRADRGPLRPDLRRALHPRLSPDRRTPSRRSTPPRRTSTPQAGCPDPRRPRAACSTRHHPRVTTTHVGGSTQSHVRGRPA